jgi:hypothetical protein
LCDDAEQGQLRHQALQQCDAIHRQQGEVGVRRILGVLSLAKKYGTAVVDEACAAALEMGVRKYRFVRRYLERLPQRPT